jgi:energy-coupling factor transporter transmembrane protein EcfT
VSSKFVWLAFDSILLFGLLTHSRLPLKQFSRDFRIWVIFLFALFLFQACFTPGTRVFTFSWLPISKEGLRLGIFTCWRLGLILGYSVFFTAITRPREIQNALIWILKPIPFLPGRQLALMVALTLRFFSIVLDQAEEVRLAHKARLGDQNRNPFRRAKFIVLPLLHRSFSRAEDVTLALAARGFRDDLPFQLPKIPVSHLIPLLGIPGFSGVIWWFHL